MMGSEEESVFAITFGKVGLVMKLCSLSRR